MPGPKSLTLIFTTPSAAAALIMIGDSGFAYFNALVRSWRTVSSTSSASGKTSGRAGSVSIPVSRSSSRIRNFCTAVFIRSAAPWGRLSHSCQRGYRMNGKQIITTLLVLLSAALLEAGGDAVVRLGLRASTTFVRASLFLIGGLVLFTYGYVVNAPQWDFGRLLGVYVVFFFLVAQFISWLVFDQQQAGGVIFG